MQTITQTQIKAYERCKRFYFLKYIRRLAWPVEKKSRQEMKLGEDFHLLVRQLILGFPCESLLIPDGDETIRGWIDSFLSAGLTKGYDRIYAERETSSLFADVLWLGKFDALAIRDDRLTIFDWKTTGHRPDPDVYRTSPQTRLYRFLARTCGPRLIGAGLHELPAENIEMVYWFPEYPDRMIRLPYSDAAFRDDLEYLKLRAREMSLPSEADYPETEKVRSCPYCDYYAYCFPGSTVPGPDMFPAADGDDLPEDVFQTEFLFGDLSGGDEREETTF